MTDDRTLHVTPSPERDTFDHKLTGFCWCQPIFEDVPPDGRLYIHRRTLDSPHIEDVKRVDAALSPTESSDD